MALTRVARTRLTDEQYEEFVETPAREAGMSVSDYLREMIVSKRTLESRVAALERRTEHVEEELARMWIQQERQNDQSVT